jgi:phosphohistidine phosphatase
MQIYLLRHGIAEDGRPGQPDSARALTPDGAKKLRAMLKRAREAGVAPGAILTSPYQRAVETAEIAAQALNAKAEIVQTPALTPDAGPEAAWSEARLHRGEAQVLLVGHEPLFSALTAHLLDSPALMLDFKKGMLVRVDADAAAARPRGVLKWALAPKLVAE